MSRLVPPALPTHRIGALHPKGPACLFICPSLPHPCSRLPPSLRAPWAATPSHSHNGAETHGPSCLWARVTETHGSQSLQNRDWWDPHYSPATGAPVRVLPLAPRGPPASQICPSAHTAYFLTGGRVVTGTGSVAAWSSQPTGELERPQARTPTVPALLRSHPPPRTSRASHFLN